MTVNLTAQSLRLRHEVEEKEEEGYRLDCLGIPAFGIHDNITKAVDMLSNYKRKTFVTQTYIQVIYQFFYLSSTGHHVWACDDIPPSFQQRNLLQ